MNKNAPIRTLTTTWGLPFCALIVLILLLWSSIINQPILFVRPPITRRTNPYKIPYTRGSNGSGCGYSLNTGDWTDYPVIMTGACAQQDTYATCSSLTERRWMWGTPAKNCSSHYIDTAATTKLLADKWIAFAGDSIVRGLAAAILRQLNAPASAFDFPRHASVQRDLANNVKLTFHWTPFPDNITGLFESLQSLEQPPDIVVTSTALWHMLYVNSAEDYSTEVEKMSEAALNLQLQEDGKPTKPFYLTTSSPELFVNKIPSIYKRAYMTPQQVDEYNTALASGWSLVPRGASGLLDLFSLTYRCGEECSVDGIHSHAVVYDAAAQILLNIYNKCGSNAQTCFSALAV